MRFPTIPTLLALVAAAAAASPWSFSDATVTVSPKAADNVVEKFSGAERVKKVVKLGHQDAIKVSLTTNEGSKPKRPHQAFLVIRESSGLEAPFTLTVKESGKGTVKITQKDLPVQLLRSKSPLEASLILGSTGSTPGSVTRVFDISLKPDPNGPAPSYEAPLRYGPLPEIHHVFREDPKNPPKIVSLVFSLAVAATVPILFIVWLLLGANVSHAQKALGSAPVSHAVFFGTLVAMECVFFIYYSSWSLFQTLPVAGVVGATAFLSGTKALGEVQRRREAGER